VRVTRSPNCGYAGSTSIQATFKFDEDGLMSILTGPEISRDILEQLLVLTNKAKKNSYTKEEFFEEAGTIASPFSKLKDTNFWYSDKLLF